MGFVEIIEWTIYIGIGIGVLFIIAAIQDKNREKRMTDELSKLDNFNSSQHLIGEGGINGIAVDEKNNQVCLISRVNGTNEFDVVPYNDLLTVEIHEDGTTVTSTSRGSQAGGALIGGIALGGVGAIIGGLSAKQTSTNKVTNIELRVIVNRTNSPTHDIIISRLEMERGGLAYKGTMDKARHWEGLIKVLIKRADEIDQTTEPKASEQNLNDQPQIDKMRKATNNSNEKNFLTRELIKLGKLREMKVLSDSEFQDRKKYLIKAADEKTPSDVSIEVAEDILNLAKMYKNKLLSKEEFVGQKLALLKSAM